ncbi:MAG: hypothetical protein RLZZ436_2672 [Planctomycetota bacterium]|jgi:hypothetical protein
MPPGADGREPPVGICTVVRALEGFGVALAGHFTRGCRPAAHVWREPNGIGFL